MIWNKCQSNEKYGTVNDNGKIILIAVDEFFEIYTWKLFFNEIEIRWTDDF